MFSFSCFTTTRNQPNPLPYGDSRRVTVGFTLGVVSTRATASPRRDENSCVRLEDGS